MKNIVKEKWTQEQCRQRYVEGERIGLRELAKISSVAIQTIAEWSKHNNWTGERERFQHEYNTRRQEKLIEKLSEDRSEEVRKLRQEHLDGYKSMRLLANIYYKKIINKVQKDPENILTISARDCQRWSNIYDRGVQGERQAMGMDYEDINLAIAIVEKAGYRVLETVEWNEN